MKIWNKKIKRSLFIILLICALFVSGCNNEYDVRGGNDDAAAEQQKNKDDIVIIFTNDVHCGIDDHIGYSGLVDYKHKMQEETPYVTLVDCGDAIQGAALGTISKGEYIIEIMNEAEYDYAILGNHEFDYGLEQLSKLMDEASYEYLGCNISYTGAGSNALEKLIPYDIVEYDDRSVAFIGVTTPYSIVTLGAKYFADADGNIVYDFGNENEDEFYALIQRYIDECRDKGADYVILLTHLGDTDTYSPYSSVDLINNTNGADAVLDGHAHNKIPEGEILNKDGEDVILASTGTKLETIGQLVITDNSIFVSTNIKPYSGEDEDMTLFVENIQKDADKELNKVLASSNTALSCFDSNGLRIVRNQETAIGNFCADAFRWASGADVCFINGGGIRADLPKGNITYEDVLDIFPYGNMLCMVEATGQEIVDALEFGARMTVKNYDQDGVSVGQNGGFYQVSGLKYTINTEISPSISTDENDVFQSVDGEYRVRDVEIMDNDGNYSPIDVNKTYTLASYTYVLKGSGDGCGIFADNTYLIEEGILDFQVLVSYIGDELKGDLSRYGSTEGRITIE